MLKNLFTWKNLKGKGVKRMRIVSFLLALLVIGLCFTGLSQASVLTFEDLYPGYETFGSPIPAGYGGFNWNSSAHWTTKNALPGTGYEYGTVGNVSLFSWWDIQGSLPLSMSDGYFDFNGAYITAAWDGFEWVTVEGLRDGSTVYSTLISTSNNPAGAPYWFDFNYLNVDTVLFTPHGYNIVIDNITYNYAGNQGGGNVPEPATLLLVGSGLVGLAGLKKKLKI
ncbi:MAG: PEP-CTERM sorting domain-containing protein [Nitrospirae bacterium]|nr:PEP-CTERM sorting domain-containing protein [Nitrospirota bacterium]